MNRKLIAVLTVAALAGAGWYWTRMQTADNMAPAEAGTPLAQVAVPAALSAQARDGKVLFDDACASCHGVNAAGRDGMAPPLVHRLYEPSHHGDMAFALAARTGVRAHHWPFGDMPPVERPLTDDDLVAIVRYVRELQRANGID